MAELTVDIWEAIVPSGVSGDLVVSLHNASQFDGYDSIAVSTLVTNVAAGAKLDSVGVGTTRDHLQSRTASDVATAGPGFLIGSAVCADHPYPFASLVGNGPNGALAKLVDMNIGNHHRHVIFALDNTAASAVEDYTGNRGLSDLWAMALASWSY